MEDLIGLGKMSEKLADVAIRFAGTLYRPRAIRNEADARAYEARVMGSVRLDLEEASSSSALRADVARRTALADVDEQIAERARDRLTRQEIQRQQNVESIADMAFDRLPSIVSDGPVNADWCVRFFRCAEDVSDREVQELWARVLAGEVAQPGSYSTRTLRVLADLTREEADSFQIVCTLCSARGYLIQTPKKDSQSVDWLSPLGLPHDKMLALQEAGLLHDVEAKSPFVSVQTDMNPALYPISLAIGFPGCMARFTPLKPVPKLEMVCMRLTTAGLQLSRLVDRPFNRAFLELVAGAYESSWEVSERHTP